MYAKKKRRVDELAVIGIDIGKDTFHLVGFDRAGQLVLRRQIKRLALTTTFEQFPRCVVGMDLALVLAIDSSSSIDEDEFRMQVLGYAAAFADPKVLRALGDAGTVDVASVFWADSAIPFVVTKWTRVRSDADAKALADTFQIFQRNAFGDTDLGAGLIAALDLFDMPGQCSARKVVNVSGDGRASIGNRRAAHTSVAEARERAATIGVTVNGLAIVNAEPKLAEYYRTQVITGPGAFVMEVQDFRAFGDAIVRKLEREIRPQLLTSLGPHPLH